MFVENLSSMPTFKGGLHKLQVIILRYDRQRLVAQGIQLR